MIQGKLFENFLTDWARVLMSIPQVTSVFYVGTTAWYSADGRSQFTPNFVVRTTDPFWDQFGEDGGMPNGRAAHMLPVQADENIMAEFCARWRETGWAPSHRDDNMLFGKSLWAAQFENGGVVRIVEAPATRTWAGPEYLRRIPGGISNEFVFEEVLRYFDPEMNTLMPPRRYLFIDHPNVETPVRTDAS